MKEIGTTTLCNVICSIVLKSSKATNPEEVIGAGLQAVGGKENKLRESTYVK